MGAPAGWYAVPNDPGTMRYWDGAAWTQDVQPLPPAPDAHPVAVAPPVHPGVGGTQPPQAVPGVIGVADALSELPGGFGRLAGAFLQQVETAAQQQAAPAPHQSQTWAPQPTSAAPKQTQGWAPQPTPGAASQQPQGWSPQQTQGWAPQPTPGAAPQQTQGWAPQPTVPHPHGAPGGELGDLWAQAKQYATSDQGRATGTAVAGGALLADGVIGFGRRREGIKGAVSGMFVGLVFIVFPLLVLKPLVLDDAAVHAGQAAIQGTVVDQHAHVDDKGQRECSPEASFVVDGKTYTAASTGSSSSCPGLGSSIKVIYRVADPADAHVAPPAWLKVFVWLFPAVGALVFLTSLWTFVVRAGEISVGGVLLFKGLRARRAAKGL